ncbi:hypothetical protein ETB97_007848 [Aspergillus alliaceus]|uniref:Uncharacterized protein n=1 Tax=Petromyces alliaceus TaxID=209559 RepID=A0A8H6E2G3_PETAA|nr:hypothetical protein ETB97_007848 [Aspergillus burnettii]
MKVALFVYFPALLTLRAVSAQQNGAKTIPGHLAYVPWTVDNVPPSGLLDITFPMSMEDSARERGWYYAQNFLFGGSSKGAYIGLQPRPNNATGPVIHAAFSSFINGTTTQDANCYEGADGGPGVSCAIDILGDYTHIYDLKVQNTGGTTWTGTLIDTVTKVEAHIGRWTLPAGTTGIKGSYVGFVEWWPFNDRRKQPDCKSLRQTSILFDAPRTSTPGAGISRLGSAYEVYDCSGKQNFRQERTGAAVKVTVGYHNPRKPTVAPWKEPDPSKCTGSRDFREACIGTEQFCAKFAQKVNDRQDCEASRWGRPQLSDYSSSAEKQSWKDPSTEPTCVSPTEECLGTARYCDEFAPEGRDVCIAARKPRQQGSSQIPSNSKRPWREPSTEPTCVSPTEDCLGTARYCDEFAPEGRDVCLATRESAQLS